MNQDIESIGLKLLDHERCQVRLDGIVPRRSGNVPELTLTLLERLNILIAAVEYRVSFGDPPLADIVFEYRNSGGCPPNDKS